MRMSTDAAIYPLSNGDHVVGTGNVPTIIIGPGAGAGSAIITGTDTSIKVAVTAGSGTSTNSIVCTILYATPFATTPQTVFSSANSWAAGINARIYIDNVSPTSLDIRVTNPSLVSGRTYVFNLITIG